MFPQKCTEKFILFLWKFLPAPVGISYNLKIAVSFRYRYRVLVVGLEPDKSKNQKCRFYGNPHKYWL